MFLYDTLYCRLIYRECVCSQVWKKKDNFCHPHELECTGISVHFASCVSVFMLQGNLF
jgi:hypothetical protein